MKKILTVLLIIAMLFGSVVPTAYAVATPTVSLSSAQGTAGETVTVTATVSNNPGIVSMYLSLTYDTTRLELISATDGKLLNEGIFGNNYKNNPFDVTWDDSMATQNNTKNGTLVTFTFKIKQNAPEGDAYVKLANTGCIFDRDLNEVEFAFVDGIVTVEHAHVFNQKNTSAAYLKTEANCTDPAVYYYNCSVCGAKGTETFTYGSALGHLYENAWTKNETQHWKDCQRANCHSRKDYGSHLWDKGVVTVPATEEHEGERKLTCITCNAIKLETIPKLNHSHSYSSEWKSDATSHWQECACGHVANKQSHAGGHASCTERAECSVCGQPYGEAKGHDYGNEWKNDATSHWQECACGHVANKQSHAGGHASCTERAECSVCGQPYGEAKGHSYSEAWLSNDDLHWHECDCGATKDKGVHTWDDGIVITPATESSVGVRKYTCTGCAKTRTEDIPRLEHVHQYSEWVHNSSSHWQQCRCGLIVNKEHHEGGKANCTERAVCEVCEQPYGEPLGHDYGDVWKHDATSHWQECKCGDIVNKQEHSGGEATCTEKAVCDVCGQLYGEFVAHVYDREAAEECYLKASATCTSKAIYYKSCVCGEKGEETFESGEPTAHHNASGKLISVGESGHVHTCDDCGATIEQTLTAHEYGEWTEVRPATESEKGLRKRECQGCDHSETEEFDLPASGKDPEGDPGQSELSGCFAILPGSAWLCVGMISLVPLFIRKKQKR